MLPYTGTFAQLGVAIENGFRMALDEQGGKLGGRVVNMKEYGGLVTDRVQRGEPLQIPVNQVIPGWTEALQLMKEGRLHGSAQSTKGGFTISGSIDFSATVINQLSGSCEATLDALRSCHEDATKCPGSTPEEQGQQQQAVKEYLAPYLDHGVLEPGEISQLEALGWQATYH